MKLFARDALLPTGWAREVAIDIDDDGTIRAIDVAFAAPGEAEVVSGPLLPGMPNVHSHAFQRALAGLTERGGPAGDDFWSWREAMYRFLERLDPDDNEAIAAQLYVEMLKAGYTAVAEFHYLHHDPAGEPYANPVEMAERIRNAADSTGIALTLLPVFYAHASFGSASTSASQRRFRHSVDSFGALFDTLRVDTSQTPTTRVGIAPHSLRAVTADELEAVVAHARAACAVTPIHIHAAEQRKEVEDCVAWCGKRPVEWLLDFGLDRSWCIVHATHMTEREAAGLAASGAVAGVCPTTEADLGDGIFAADAFFAAGGRLGIGGDSHVGVDPFAELRLFESTQRLKRERRNVLAGQGESSGVRLWQTAAIGGAQALAQPVGAIAVGRRADFVVLNAEEPALVEQRPQTLLDAAIFGPGRRVVRDVMVAGRWVVGDGHHADEEAILVRYRQTMKRLLA